MGEVRTLEQILKDLGAPELIANALGGLAQAVITAEHDMVDKDPDDTLLGAFITVQRVLDLCDILRQSLFSLGIDDSCAAEIAKDFEHPVAASVSQVGRQMQHALVNLLSMLTANTPVELLNKINAAHAPKKEVVRGEAKDEDGAAPASAGEDSQ